MPLIEFNSRPGLDQLRRFASIGLPLVLSGLAALAWRRGFPDATYACAILAALTFTLGRMRPQWFRPLYVASLTVSYPFAWLLGYLLLAAVYFLLIAPIGLILRLVRHDPLARSFDREAQSYWVARSASDDRQRYFRQY
jgi:hypothetical protein